MIVTVIDYHLYSAYSLLLRVQRSGSWLASVVVDLSRREHLGFELLLEHMLMRLGCSGCSAVVSRQSVSAGEGTWSLSFELGLRNYRWWSACLLICDCRGVLRVWGRLACEWLFYVHNLLSDDFIVELLRRLLRMMIDGSGWGISMCGSQVDHHILYAWAAGRESQLLVH